LETFNIISGDSAASLKLLDSKLPALFLHPDAIAKAMDDWNTMSTENDSKEKSRQKTFEAAIKRATLRANVSQQHAEAKDKELEAKKKELEAKDKDKELVEAKNKELEAKNKELEAKDKDKELVEAKNKELEAKINQLTDSVVH